MRSKVPFPAGPGDWRYDPTTGRLINASKTPPEQVHVTRGHVAELSGDPDGIDDGPITLAEPDEFVDMTEREGGPGIPAPPIKLTKRRKR